MNLETLEFIIYPDGRIKETVTGIIGNSCQEVTAAIEAELGQVVNQEKSSEYFAQTVNTSEVVINEASWTDW